MTRQESGHVTDRVTGRVTIADYMALHQVSESTVRRKIRAGELTASKEQTPHGLRWFIADQPDQARDQSFGGQATGQTTSHHDGHVTSQTPGQTSQASGQPENTERLIATLEEQNLFLRQELESRTAEIDRLHHVLMQQATALQALPAMIATPPSEQAASATTAAPPAPPPEPSPWWKRLLGI